MKESHPLVQRQLPVQRCRDIDFRLRSGTIFENSSGEVEAPSDAGEVKDHQPDQEPLTSGPDKPDEDTPACSDHIIHGPTQQVLGDDNTAKANATEDCGKSLEEAPGFVF